jgi:hypothetical protein
MCLRFQFCTYTATGSRRKIWLDFNCCYIFRPKKQCCNAIFVENCCNLGLEFKECLCCTYLEKMNVHKIGLVINTFHTDNFHKMGILWCTVLI